MKDSRIAGFYRMSIAERIDALAERKLLDPAAAADLRSEAALLDRALADRIIENVVAVFGLPLAVAPNFTVNGRDYLAPMAVEEPSIVAGVSGAARLARDAGGFQVASGDSLLAGQILLVDVDDPDAAIRALKAESGPLLELANADQPRLAARGGGARSIELYRHELPGTPGAVALHLLVDTCDAMGANLVNSMCERIAPSVEKYASGRALLRILSNLSDRSLVTARVRIPPGLLANGLRAGAGVRDDIVLANRFANVDPHRAATHNKGIMNGVDAVAVATGNDWRAVEAAAHAYAARDGRYRSLTEWTVGEDGSLCGRLTLPLKVGTVGGALRANPAAVMGLTIAGVESAGELAALIASVGLAQNLAALRALVTGGIQKGHMRLHARSVAASVGTPAEHFEEVVQALIDGSEIKAGRAEELLARLRRPVGPAADAASGIEPQGTASGKVILLGEHAAVYGRHALALPIERAALASIDKDCDETRLTVSEPGRIQDFAAAPRSVGGASHMLAFIVERLGLGGRHFHVRLNLRIPTAMGLGSSAAASVAIVRAFDRSLNLGLTDTEVNRVAFDCEKLAHGDPSGIDNTLATYGRPVLFRRGAESPVRQLELRALPPLVIAASGQRGVTRDQVAAVRRRYDGLPARYERLFDEIDALALAAAEALTAGDYDTLGSMMNICHGLLNALQVSTPELEKMVQIAREQGAIGAKLTGAGGGGSIVALCPGSTARVAGALQGAGYRIVRMSDS